MIDRITKDEDGTSAPLAQNRLLGAGVGDKKYSIIYADPAWSYNDSLGNNPDYGGITYKTMSIDEIKALPVKTMADKDCVLFIWVTSPLLIEGLEVIESWGFKFKTLAFNWIKVSQQGNYYHNSGRWTMGNCELCLLATKGKPQRVRKDIKQLQILRREGHSKKPDLIRKLIVDLMGDLPRVELFARGQKNRDLFDFNRFDGWDTWGNQVENSIELKTGNTCT